MSAAFVSLQADDDAPSILEVATQAADSDTVGIGTSPAIGDTSSTGVRVPAAATTAQTNRYLIRLCGVEIPERYVVRILGLRQLATIRATEELNGEPFIVEREIVSPLWRFLDGNISWHLRVQTNQFSRYRSDAAQVAGTSPQMRGLDSALLYQPPLAPYTALAAGMPPGRPVGAYGTWRDIRFPWTDTSWDLAEVVRGPGAVVFYASVHQTDPTQRPLYSSAAGLRPEDQFVANYPEAIYGRVAGAMTFEFQRKRFQ